MTVLGTVISEVSSEESPTTRSVAKGPDREILPPEERTPAPSVVDAGIVRTRFLFSLSATSMEALPAFQPATEAVRVTVCASSTSTSSMMVKSKEAELSPAGMMTKAGTTTSLVSLEDRETTTSSSTGVFTLTSPWDERRPSPSAAEEGSSRERIAVSLSWTNTLREAEAYPGADAVTVTCCEPSRRASSTMVKSKVTDVWPAGTVIAGGTSISDVSLEVRLIKRSIVDGGSIRISPSPAIVPLPSVKFSARIRERAVASKVPVFPGPLTWTGEYWFE